MATREISGAFLSLLFAFALAGCESGRARLDRAVTGAQDGGVMDGGFGEGVADASAPHGDAAARAHGAGGDSGSAGAADAAGPSPAGAAGRAGLGSAGKAASGAAAAAASGAGGSAASAGTGTTAGSASPAAGSGGAAADSGGSGAQAGAPSVPQTPSTFIELDSDQGDYIGQGGLYSYTKANSVLALAADAGRLTVTVDGDEHWKAVFVLPAGNDPLRPGNYPDVSAYPAQDMSRGALDWSGEGRGCGATLGSWIAIDAVSYDAGQLAQLDLRFEQHCKGSSGALHGRIHRVASDPTVPPGPVSPPPSDLWRASEGATPASGNYVYLLSDPGAPGGGLGYLYTQSDAILTVSAVEGSLGVRVQGEEDWQGSFATMISVHSLQEGYYGELRGPQSNPARGSLAWIGAGGCDIRDSWFAIDHASYDAAVLTALDLRFELRCRANNAVALHGQIHWRGDDPTAPPPPVKPVPGDLWRAAASGVPSSGNYVYFEGQANDPIAAGKSYLYTQANAALMVGAANTRISVRVTGDEEWYGDFKAMAGVSALEPAYYANAEEISRSNPARPGLDWFVVGHSCDKVVGWLAIDRISYDADRLTALDFRFEQRCSYATGLLHGQVHWVADDPTRPAGPVNPPPSGLWQPPSGALPASGGYVYLQSDPGEFVGAGSTYSYSGATPLMLTTRTDGVSIQVADWSGFFVGMQGIGQLTPGYYVSLGNSNPTRSSLGWIGQGRSCSGSGANRWFVVERAEYVNGSVTLLDLRFELHCSSGAPAFHGAIHFAP